MFICIKKYNEDICIVADTDSKDIGFVKNSYEIYDAIEDDEPIFQLDDEMTKLLMKEGVIREEF